MIDYRKATINNTWTDYIIQGWESERGWRDHNAEKSLFKARNRLQDWEKFIVNIKDRKTNEPKMTKCRIVKRTVTTVIEVME